MRKLILCGLLLQAFLSGRAEDILIKDVFRQMPDSILPSLSANSRLDFIDFKDSGMKAEVKNELGGQSEMTSLTDSTLTIRMSAALQVEMRLLRPVQAADSSRVICLIQTYGTDSLGLESQVDFYSLTWQRLAEVPLLTTADKAYVSAFRMQTILKRDDEILKKN